MLLRFAGNGPRENGEMFRENSDMFIVFCLGGALPILSIDQPHSPCHCEGQGLFEDVGRVSSVLGCMPSFQGGRGRGFATV